MCAPWQSPVAGTSGAGRSGKALYHVPVPLSDGDGCGSAAVGGNPLAPVGGGTRKSRPQEHPAVSRAPKTLRISGTKRDLVSAAERHRAGIDVP